MVLEPSTPSNPHTALLPAALPPGDPASVPKALPFLRLSLEQGPEVSKPHSAGTLAPAPRSSSAGGPGRCPSSYELSTR